MNQRRWNWHLWVGFLVCLFAFGSYPSIFVKFPATRDVPWANFLLFGTGGLFLWIGIKRAFAQSQEYRGKIAGPILGTLSFAALAFFCFIVFYMTKQMPAASVGLHVGQKAPDFVLPDSNSNAVSLSSLLSTPLSKSQSLPKGVLLVFYRGSW